MHKTQKAAILLAALVALRARPAADEQQQPKQQPPATEKLPRIPGPAAELPASTSSLKNTVRWKTNKLNNYGYDVFRAEAETGPFQKLNAQLLPGGGKGTEKHEFEYVDGTIEAHKAYWYYVEAVDLMGKRSRFTPTLKAAPKRPAEPLISVAPR